MATSDDPPRFRALPQPKLEDIPALNRDAALYGVNYIDADGNRIDPRKVSPEIDRIESAYEKLRGES